MLDDYLMTLPATLVTLRLPSFSVFSYMGERLGAKNVRIVNRVLKGRVGKVGGVGNAVVTAVVRVVWSLLCSEWSSHSFSSSSPPPLAAFQWGRTYVRTV